MEYKTIPITRIFDEQKAKDFYLGYLGMQLDWEHRFEPALPIYMQVSKGNFVLHLSEHPGDCSPGSKLFVEVDNLEDLYYVLSAKDYPYCSPEIETPPWGGRCFTITDPFSNRILFNQAGSHED